MKKIAIILVAIFLLMSIGATVYIIATQRMEIRKEAKSSCPIVADNFQPTKGTVIEENGKFIYTITNYDEFTPSGRRIYLYDENYEEITNVENQSSLTYDFAANSRCGKFIFTHHLAYTNCNVCSFYPVEGEPPIAVRPLCAPKESCSDKGTCRAYTPDWSLPAEGVMVEIPCVVPTVTPQANTPTPTMATKKPVSPTAVPTKKAGTGGVNIIPECLSLSAYPVSGTAPLTVHYVATGSDQDGTIAKFEFTYGDGQIQQIQKDVGGMGSVEMEHTFTLNGTFVTNLRVADNLGDWSVPNDNCKRSIVTAQSQPAVEGASTGRGAPGTTMTPTIIPTTTPLVTPSPTRVSTPSATLAQPNVPTAGNITPTIMVGIGGFLILALGLLFAF